ncbi:MAG: ABC transporter ATP-binding protein/permease [Candidatus Obscuribacterales bacterium]|jgi:subfamily B ATP-binding cassette protein MsbA|nr:ABC transporter ATP-binding protein/permease [Candidatus Obscuribacterales bacterium]
MDRNTSPEIIGESARMQATITNGAQKDEKEKALIKAEKKDESVSQFQVYVRLLNYIKPYWMLFALGVLAAIPSGSMDAAIAWLAGQGLQKIIVDGQERLIYWVPILVLIVAGLQGIFRFLEAFTIRYVGAAAIRDLRNELFCHLESQPLLYFQGISSGILIGRLTNDVAIIENAISQTFQSMISRTTTLISLIVVLLCQSWKLSLIALSILSFIVLPVNILSRKIRKSSRVGQEAIGDLVSVISESIGGAKIVQSFNLESYQISRFMATNQHFFDNAMKSVRAEAMMSPILAMIGALGIAAVMWAAGWQVVHHVMTLGALTSFVIALLLLYSPIKNIGRINGIIQPALAAAARVFEVLDRKPELADSPNAIPLPEGNHHIKFDNVFFHYPTTSEEKAPQMVLQDINLEIPAGKMLALVGLSGSGKSTLVNLVPRFFDTTAGTILIDGKPLQDYTMASLRSQIAVVTQDNFLFNATVSENIRLGRIDASDEDVVAAAGAAYCHDFIKDLPDGYNTRIGERGVRLSGGQQQRLSIARAFLKNAPILILDEATSSLDNESEKMVQAALNDLMRGRTVIVIAHRLTTVRHADVIVVLEGGRIIEVGSHQQLASAGGAYDRLLKAQFERPAP